MYVKHLISMTVHASFWAQTVLCLKNMLTFPKFEPDLNICIISAEYGWNGSADWPIL